MGWKITLWYGWAARRSIFLKQSTGCSFSFSRGLPCLGPSWASKWVCLPAPEVHIPEKLSQNAPALSCTPGEGGRQLVTALPVVSSHRGGMFWQSQWFYTRVLPIIGCPEVWFLFFMHPTSTDILKWPAPCTSLHLVALQVSVLSNFMAHSSSPLNYSNSRIKTSLPIWAFATVIAFDSNANLKIFSPVSISVPKVMFAKFPFLSLTSFFFYSFLYCSQR